MKTALITTTINVPHVLRLYRKFGPLVQFFVAGDRKTPADVNVVLPEVQNYYSPEYQQSLGYKCSELIGWNCIQRRNIALLEAVKWGAEIIVSIDDDNIPMGGAYFHHFENALYYGLSGASVVGYAGWFDVGQMLSPVAKHRGFPFDQTGLYQVGHTIDAQVGVAAGICLGDPDIDAVTRLVNRPAPITADSVSELLRNGVVVQPPTRTVFNSQNTAIIRELAPAFFMPPGLGRYDDIFASLICQRVMRERNLHVHFGPPFVWQQRNAHNLINDLRQELWGMENILGFAATLDDFDFVSNRKVTVLEQCRAIWSDANVRSLLPEQSWKAALAFCDDMSSVL